MDKNKTIGTHSGSFQTDEVTGVMLLKNYVPEYKDAKIIRSRDYNVLKDLDIVIDVGQVYDHEKRRYDHHQKGFNETFGAQYETPLSSAGLVFKHFYRPIIENAVLELISLNKIQD